MVNVATGNRIPQFSAAQGVLKFDTSAVTFDESSSVGSKYATTATVAAIIDCKDITVTPPKSEAEMVNLLGQESVTVGAGIPVSGSFQNAIYDEKAWADASMTCTLVLTGNETYLPDFLKLATASGTDVGSYKRHTFGNNVSAQARNNAGSVILILNNGLEEMNVLMNKPIFNMGDIKPTGMDGHFEVSYEAKCLPKNFVIDIKEI